MVYCTKCGTQNEEDAVACVNCGVSLAGPAWRSKRKRLEKEEQECFGLPHGGAIAGLIFGAIIIIVGAILALQEWDVIEEIDLELIWPSIVIIFGVLIVAGALYGFSRRS